MTPQAPLSGVRRRQPLLRAQRGADAVPAGPPQGRHRLHRGPRPHQDHGAQRGQRLHPQPHLRGGRPARRSGGVLPARQRRQELPRGDGQAHEGDPRIPQPAARLEVMDGLGLDYTPDVPDPGQPGRGADEGRSRADPRRHPRAQPVDVRDLAVQLRGPDLLHSGHQRCPIVDRALEELEWCLERGAKTVLVRPAPYPACAAPVRSAYRSSTRSGTPA